MALSAGRKVPAPSASLRFVGATTDRVDCGSASMLDNMTAWSALVWFYPTASFVSARIVEKFSATGWAALYHPSIDHALRILWLRATTNYDYQSAAGAGNVLVANAWNFVAFTAEQTAAGRIYIGSERTPATEVSYGTANLGSGAFSDDSALQVCLGNETASPGAAPAGRLETVGLFNRALPLGEIRGWQRNVLPGCVGLWHLGRNGTGLVIDESGNGNHGTRTGAVVAEGPPVLTGRRRRSFAGAAADLAPFGVHAPYPGMYPFPRRR